MNDSKAEPENRVVLSALDLNKKKLWIALLFVGLILLVNWLIRRDPMHPEFGRIREVSMMESGSWKLTRRDKIEATVRKWLHLKKRPDPPRYLDIGPHGLEWSAGQHYYMRVPRQAWQGSPYPKDPPLWEFALCSNTNLLDVTRDDLDCEFYFKNDPRGTNAFGLEYKGRPTRPAWQGNSIRIPEGTIFFARMATNRPVVYIIQSGKQIGYGTRVRFMVATNAAADRTGTAQ